MSRSRSRSRSSSRISRADGAATASTGAGTTGAKATGTGATGATATGAKATGVGEVAATAGFVVVDGVAKDGFAFTDKVTGCCTGVFLASSVAGVISDAFATFNGFGGTG
ncbi:unnamed protein product [[Candida] boidinii]|nr:unnamed protein product [[Candida] boidinii]